jgi:hypothetical protein
VAFGVCNCTLTDVDCQGGYGFVTLMASFVMYAPCVMNCNKWGDCYLLGLLPSDANRLPQKCSTSELHHIHYRSPLPFWGLGGVSGIDTFWVAHIKIQYQVIEC